MGILEIQRNWNANFTVSLSINHYEEKFIVGCLFLIELKIYWTDFPTRLFPDRNDIESLARKIFKFEKV